MKVKVTSQGSFYYVYTQRELDGGWKYRKTFYGCFAKFRAIKFAKTFLPVKEILIWDSDFTHII